MLACDTFGRDMAARPAGADHRPLTELRDDPERLVGRTRAGRDRLSRVQAVDERTAVVGFCFGGLAALQLARSGAPIAAAVSIHGSLATCTRAEPGQVRARLLVCHGAADPHVPVADVTAFAEEMNTAGADRQLTMYGGVEHGFTHAEPCPARSLASRTTSRPMPFRSPCPRLPRAGR